jgi:hypothetical protein
MLGEVRVNIGRCRIRPSGTSGPDSRGPKRGHRFNDKLTQRPAKEFLTKEG